MLDAYEIFVVMVTYGQAIEAIRAAIRQLGY